MDTFNRLRFVDTVDFSGLTETTTAAFSFNLNANPQIFPYNAMVVTPNTGIISVRKTDDTLTQIYSSGQWLDTVPVLTFYGDKETTLGNLYAFITANTIDLDHPQPDPTTTIERSKIMTTGYKVIDFRDNNLTTTAAVTIPGIHDAIEAAYRKPLLLSGLTVAGVEKPAVFAQVTESSGSYQFTAYGYKITISAADAVSVATA